MAIKVILTVPERINFPTILPPSGSLSEMEMAKALAERVALTKKEETEFGYVKLSESQFAFDPKKAQAREFTFESFEILLIQQGVNIHDERKTIYPFNLELAKKFKAIKVESKNIKEK